MPSTPRSRAAFAALAGALLLAPAGSPVAAQADAPRATAGPEISASGLVLAPLALLTDSDVSFDTEVSSSAGVTGGLTWWVGRHLGVAARAAWAPAQLNLRGAPLGAAVPDDLGDADYLAGTVEATWRFLPGGAASMLEPFVSVGGGVRHLELEPVAAPEARTATDPAATAAAGSRVRLWESASLRLELRDVVSSYDAGETGEARIQHDVLLSVGLSLRP